MKNLLRGVFIPLLLGCLAYPQQSADADKLTKEQVQEFLDLMQSRQMMAQLVEGMRAAQKVGFEETFKRLVPNARPDLLQKVDSLTDEAFLDFPVQEMLDAIIPIYQRHLTKTDFDGIIRFYKSPIGQKFLKERPAMVQESMQAGQAIMFQNSRISWIDSRPMLQSWPTMKENSILPRSPKLPATFLASPRVVFPAVWPVALPKARPLV